MSLPPVSQQQQQEFPSHIQQHNHPVVQQQYPPPPPAAQQQPMYTPHTVSAPNLPALTSAPTSANFNYDTAAAAAANFVQHPWMIQPPTTATNTNTNTNSTTSTRPTPHMSSSSSNSNNSSNHIHPTVAVVSSPSSSSSPTVVANLPPRTPMIVSSPAPPSYDTTRTTATQPPPFIVWSQLQQQQQQQHSMTPPPQPPSRGARPTSSPSPILAARQERFPIVLVATAAAHRMAWKNGLRLSDLLQGLVVSNHHGNNNSGSSSSNTSSTTTSSTHRGDPGSATASGGGGATTIPFRSVSRLLHIPLDQWHRVQFLEEDQLSTVSDMQAVQTLQQVTNLQTSDGNLQNELELLEDQIDNLLSDDTHCSSITTSSTTTSSSSSTAAAADGTTVSSMDYYTRTNHHHEQEQYQQVVSDAYRLTSTLTIPWLCRYRQASDACTDHWSHEQWHCPALIIFVATTSEEETTTTTTGSDIVTTIRALQSNYHYWPKQYRNGMFDPTPVRREVLVLHDNVDYATTTCTTTNLDETAIRTQLKMCFGATSAIVRINSLALETASQLALEETTDVWGGGGKLGNCLTVGDRARIRKYMSSMITSALVPAVERRVADLNVIVSDRKKGVRNVLKSFWGGNTRSKRDEDDVTTNTLSSSMTHSNNDGSNNNDVKYRFDSIETQTRLLADTLFLVRDYDAALSMYRLIKDDFKQDKNWIHYGSVQEMMALSMYMLDPYGRAKEIFSCIENALLSYSRAADESQSSQQPGRATIAPISTRLATRLCLVLLAARHICSGRHLEVADLLASASSHETALGAAVLLEQSSAHYYKAEMYRKYAFHMLMSGHMFRTAEQEHHAFRCFTSALYIYRDGKWDELHNHVRSAVAAQLFSMGRMSIALQLYAKLLGTTGGGRVSVKSQQKFIQNLLEICNDHRKKALSGADRMAAPPHLSGAKRDAVRTERLDRIVQVIRYTKSASRVLELPNMNLPLIDDSTVVVIAEEAAHYRQESVPSFGDAQVGAVDIWDDLMLTMEAELKAVSDGSIRITKTLSKIEDPDLRRVIALLEEAKTNRSKLERTKKATTYVDSALVRAVKEPISVEFALRNPLSIPIDVCDLQLVARMTGEHKNRICTNEDAVSIRPLVTSNEKKKWKFQSSNVVFEMADFCRVSAGRSDDADKEAWKSAEDVEPFFVVTKSNITIPPETKLVISGSICPLSRGNLEVLGVRCRLFDSVWVYHPFDIKGPLLQNTRSNRANRVRGESFLLKSKVERGMPCLSVELRRPETFVSSNDGPALHDQIGDWILRISNVGTSSGSNISLKTNIPWIYVRRDKEPTENGDKSDEMPISYNIGPTGTLMTIPILGCGLQVSGQIQPGESFDVPIKMRTSGVGKRDFYMLFRYQLYDENDLDKPRCRWLKKMFSVPVYPSLDMTAFVSPSFDASQEHILSVELTNCRTDRPDLLDIDLSRLTIASRHYDLEPINDSVFPHYSVALRWQERAAVHFKLIQKNSEEEMSLLTHCPLSSSNDPSIEENTLNFLALERAHDAFEETVRLHQMALSRAAAQGDDENQLRSVAAIRRANTVDSGPLGTGDDINASHPTSIERLCPSTGAPDTIHIVCSWNVHHGSLHGLNHIRGLLVRPHATNKTEGCPITVTAVYPSAVSNNFQSGPAIVPLKVTLHNTLIEASVGFEFVVDNPDTFDITGPERHRASLKGGEEISIPLQALIPAVGIYNLQKIRLVVNDGEPVPFSYVFPLQWMVAVTEIQ
jgi:ER-Golgi trafficking TRAPP I complex 85 kDa subunit